MFSVDLHKLQLNYMRIVYLFFLLSIPHAFHRITPLK